MSESNKPPETYVPVPVHVAGIIARDFQKQIVVVVSVDHRHDQTHVTTFGEGPENKILAAALGEEISKATGHDMSQSHYFQDFRTVEAAKYVAKIEALEEAIRQLRTAAEPIVAAFDGIDDWGLGDETDRVYPWHEIEPLQLALVGLAKLMPGVTSVLGQVAAERERQREKGFDDKHDDRLIDGSLARCARSILDQFDFNDVGGWPIGRAVHITQKYDERQRLIIAQALLAAEVERRDRLDANMQIAEALSMTPDDPNAGQPDPQPGDELPP